VKSLLDRWPALGTVALLPLASLPTPLVRASALSAALATEIWIKRDDLTSTRYGGNKVRKLELLVGLALARGARTIVTLGALGSHHVLATGLVAKDAGLRVMAVLVPQPITDHVRENLRAILAAGVEVVPVAGYAGAFAKTLSLAARAEKRDGVRPLVVGPGGSNAIGTIGYIDAGLELAGQIERGEAPAPEHVFVALGSGGTAAGLLAGLRLAGLSAQVHGVVVTDGAPIGATAVRWLARGALRRLRRIAPGIPSPTLDGLVIDTGELGAGYGHETDGGREAIELAARLEGVTLEPTYTGKTLAALVREARGPLRGKRLLYWHTLSGTPARALELPDLHPDRIPEALRSILT
jgi:1-aminocyclopropane-1-carboxylate deaminase/D-cysteine desulfhydrase-like pyridoxal-dependent ACC family enzyme